MKAITISDEQFSFIIDKDKEFKPPSETSVELCDYRNLKGKFDKILSIEMIEAVGAKYWPDYFGTLKRCLRDGGTIGLQAITIKEDFYKIYRHLQFHHLESEFHLLNHFLWDLAEVLAQQVLHYPKR